MLSVIKRLFHPDTDWRRVAVHVPHGLVIGLSGLYLPWVIPLCGTLLFLDYEKNEDRHKKDQAWNDILGALVGLSGVVIGALLVKLIQTPST